MKEHEVGFVTEAKQYVLMLEGLPSAKVNDVLVSDSGRRALVRSLVGSQLTALSLDPGSPAAGDRYTYIPDAALYSLGEHLFGRIINVLGEPVDGGEPFPSGNTPLELDVDPPGIEVRAPITEQLHTGVTLVDTLLPIAKGQRQLLFGPVRGAKTDFLIDSVLNQAQYGTICIYTVIGKSLSELERIESRVLGSGAAGKTIIIAALSDQPSPRISIAPAIGFLVADYFQRKGHDVLVILDDLDVHAKYLREIALLEDRLPGRESYPGDLFYQQAHLLERSGRFSAAFGGGSITVLPVIDTDAYAALGIVSTNLMSCTDGHLSFVATLSAEGVYPAISEEQSITRIGRSAQSLLQKQLSFELRMALAASQRERQYAQFGTQVSKAVAHTLHLGDIIEALMRQEPGVRVPVHVQVPLLALAFSSFFESQEIKFAAANRQKIIEALGSRKELHDLTQAALTETPFQDYLKKIEAQRPIFEAICRA